MPKPTIGQGRKEFLAVFMADEEMKTKYPDEKQRYAVAISEWEQHMNKSVYKNDEDNVHIDFEIKKTTDEGLVSGWANISLQSDGTPPFDWQDDIIRPEVLEKAAINFMMDYRSSGVMHKGESQGIVVESIVFTKEKQQLLKIPEGCVPEGWFITVKVTNKEVFEDVKAGKYRMFSIQGQANRYKL